MHFIKYQKILAYDIDHPSAAPSLPWNTKAILTVAELTGGFH